MEPCGTSSSEDSAVVEIITEGRSERRLMENGPRVPNTEVGRFKNQVLAQDKLIKSLKAEIKMLQGQLSEKDNDLLSLTKVNYSFAKQLADSRQRIEHLEQTQRTLERTRDRNYNRMQAVLDQNVSENVRKTSRDEDSKGNLEIIEYQMMDTSSHHSSIHNDDAASSSNPEVQDTVDASYLQSDNFPTISIPETEFQHEDQMVALAERTRELKCETCNETFTFNTSDIDVEDMQSFKCRTCKQKGSKQPSPSPQECPNTNKKIFKCSICSREFNFPSKLKNHLRTHTGEKPYSCDICGKGFALSFNLKIHYQTHSGIRPFMCRLCGRGFHKSKSLAEHMCTQKLNGYILCKNCDSSYAQGSYKSHRCVPVDGRRNLFPCDLCELSFISPRLLTKHQVTHLKDDLYCCKVCGKKFASSSVLKTHNCEGSFSQVQAFSSRSSGIVVEPPQPQVEKQKDTNTQSSNNVTKQFSQNQIVVPEFVPVTSNALKELCQGDARDQPEFYDISHLVKLESPCLNSINM